MMVAENVLLFGPKTDETEAVSRQEIVHTLHELLSGHADLRAFPGNFKLALRDRIWQFPRRLAGGSVLEPTTFKEFIYAKYPVGLGADYRTVERLIEHDTRTLEAFRTLMTGKKGGDRKSAEFHENINNDNIIIDHHPAPAQGTSKAYTLTRLHRDAPKLYEAVARGELSANAAAIQAGFRKKLTKFDQIVKWLPTLTAEERRQLKDLL